MPRPSGCMANEGSANVTVLLDRIKSGDDAATNELMSIAYEELRAIAGHMFRDQPGGHTLQPTALVNEVCIKLLKSHEAGNAAAWNDRKHFFRVAAKAMRQVLIAHARQRGAQKRGAGGDKVPLDLCLERLEAETGDVLAFDETMARLAAESPRAAQVVEMRVFGGMTIEEVAEALDVGLTAVKADWRFARVWLQRELGEGPAGS